MKGNIISIIISIIISYITSVNRMSFKLEKGEDLCLSEYFSDKTLVVYEIQGDQAFDVEIHDSEDRVKAKKVT
jgi:hypothetical protein